VVLGSGGGTFDIAGTTSMEVHGVVSDATANVTINLAGTSIGLMGSLTKTGTGTLLLSGANTYTGPTRVSNGTLLVSGSTASDSAVTVDSTGKLGGNGTVAGAVTVDGTLSPGLTSTPATLTTGNLKLGGTSKLVIDVNPSTVQMDKVAVSGTVDVTGSTLNLVASASASPFNQTFVLILNDNADAVTGSFAGLTRGGPNDSASFDSGNGLAYTLYYSFDSVGNTITGGNDVAIAFTSVPEPTGLGLISLGGMTLLRRRRRSIASVR